MTVERFLADARVADQERRLRLALAAGKLGTWQYDLATGLVTWDERLEAIYGLDPGTFPGTYDAYLALLCPGEREEVTATVRRAMTSGGGFRVQHRVLWPDGAVRWIEGQGHTTVDGTGKVTGAIGCSRDITDSVVTAERTERMRRLTEDLATTYTLDEVGAVVRGYAREALGAVSGSVLLVNLSGRALVPVATFGHPPGGIGPGQQIRLDSDTPFVQAFRTGEAVHVTTGAQCWAAYPGGSGGGTVVCLPLVAARTAIGTLVLGFGTDRTFDEAEHGLLVALAGQCSQAVERARLVGRLRHIAGELQHGLAPDAVPHVPGLGLAARYRPGGDELEEVGGDWYDVVAHDDGRVSLVIGDVMGRGVSAAAAMIRLRSAVRAYATDDPEPARVLDRLDRLVARGSDLAIDDFVTVLYALVNPRTGQVELVSAGHLPPLLVDAGCTATTVRLRPSPPVGLAAQWRPVATVALPVGGVLLAFTDGLVERSDQSIDEGMSQLSAAAGMLVRRRLPLSGLLTELVDLLAAGDSGDDVTVLAARLTPAGG